MGWKFAWAGEPWELEWRVRGRLPGMSGPGEREWEGVGESMACSVEFWC